MLFTVVELCGVCFLAGLARAKIRMARAFQKARLEQYTRFRT